MKFGSVSSRIITSFTPVTLENKCRTCRRQSDFHYGKNNVILPFQKVKNAPLPQNAVGRLNDRFRNLKYDVIQSSQDIRTRSWNFTVCLKLQGQVSVVKFVTKLLVV